MVVYYGLIDDVIDYGYIDVLNDLESIEYVLDRDLSWWIVPGTLGE